MDALPGTAVDRTDVAYNASTTGKPAWLALNRPIAEAEAAKFDKIYADRWRTLLAVDDLVEGVVNALDQGGLLATTYVFFTSDHGETGFEQLPRHF
jgi:N-acetylglucosamine-6-sulfatase